MNKDLKEMEQIYCLEVPKGIFVTLGYSKKIKEEILYISGKTRGASALIELFDKETLKEQLSSFCIPDIEIHGVINGPMLQFSPIDVILNTDYISVPLAKEMCKFLKFDFVPYSIVSPKEVEFQTGVILRPIQECVDEDGNRIIEEIKG